MITGHSLGGVFAQFAALYLNSEGYLADYIYTTGAPRFANSNLAEFMNETFPSIIRITSR